MKAVLSSSVWRWYLLALLIVVLDQATKLWASSNLAYGLPLEFTSFFSLTLLHNTGAAFSFLSDAGGWQRWLFGIIAAAVSVTLVVWIARTGVVATRAKRWETCALSLVLAGALGNLYDRVSLGYVVDFIVLHYERHYWPAFNIADMSITAGAMVLIAIMFFYQDE